VISHEKVFNEAMCAQDDVYLLIFPIYYIDSVSPKLSQEVIGVFSQHIKNEDIHFSHWIFEGLYKSTLIFFRHGFWRCLISKICRFNWPKENVKKHCYISYNIMKYPVAKITTFQ
jgi:hypothetical protein